MKAPDGTASLKAMEQLGNLKARLAGEQVDAARRTRDAITQPDPKRKRGSRPRRARPSPNHELSAANKQLTNAAVGGRTAIAQAMELFDRLLAFEKTVERESLYGSAFKRLALIEAAMGQSDAEAKAIEGMAFHYGRAEALARHGDPGDLFYPAMNRMAAELARVGPSGRPQGLDAAAVTAVRQSAEARAKTDPDFWSIEAQIELTMYEALAAGNLNAKRAAIEAGYQNLHDRVSANRMWGSVYDTASFLLTRSRAVPRKRTRSRARPADVPRQAGPLDCAAQRHRTTSGSCYSPAEGARHEDHVSETSARIRPERDRASAAASARRAARRTGD